MLTQARVRELFDYLDGDLIVRVERRGKRRRLGEAVPGLARGRRYRVLVIDRRTYLYHRVVYLWHHAKLPKTLDHVDRDPTNNRIENLRPATQRQNCRNKSKRPGLSSMFKGVSYVKNKNLWRALIKIDKGRKYLGCFKCEIEAARAYDAAARTHFGEFACLNFPEVA